jgi:dihydroorotate dehydrogenase (NAD+) catalytic subunit
MQKPFYDPFKTYLKNYEEGPSNAFADGEVFEPSGEPQYDYLGQKVYLPFGIPAGPLLNSKYIKAAFEKGFDIAVYKTVRTSIFPCHPYPNLLAIHKDKLSLEDLKEQVQTDKNFTSPLSITNSFGVPSKDPLMWQEDVKKAISYEKKGQVVVLSFMGTVRADQTEQDFIDDYILAGKLAKETGVKILEVNLSCPNIGNLGLVCYNLDTTKKVLEGIRNAIDSTPLVIKVGYYQQQEQLEKLAEIANEYASSIAAINTLQAAVVNTQNKQALPGKQRLRSGICGHAIKWAGIDTVERLKALKEKNNYKFAIEGVGGVTVAEDYADYKAAGADSVMSATGAMWNPLLAQEIKKREQ